MISYIKKKLLGSCKHIERNQIMFSDIVQENLQNKIKFKSNSLVFRLWSIDQRVSFSAELLQWCWICRQMNMEFTLTHVLPYNVTNFSENFLRFITKILNNVNETKKFCISIFTNALYGEFSFKCLETTNSTCTVYRICVCAMMFLSLYKY